MMLVGRIDGLRMDNSLLPHAIVLWLNGRSKKLSNIAIRFPNIRVHDQASDMTDDGGGTTVGFSYV